MFNDPNGLLKRAFDFLGAALGLILLSPVLLLCAAAVYLDDGWPIFYVQERIGRKGRPFPFFKFRTMVRQAEKMGLGLEIVRNDQRITRVGRFLRRWSLDELPQLLNVLRGEMSLVGPRPTVASQVQEYTPRQRRRLEVRPGLTGWAQINGRNLLTWPQRIELDIDYIDRYSLAWDLQIIGRTFKVLTQGDQIYGYGWNNPQFPNPTPSPAEGGGQGESPRESNLPSS